MANKVRYGLTNVHVAILTEDDNKVTYGDFKRVRGAVNLTLDPKGDQSPFYADNMAYHIFTSNQGYEGSLEVADIPEFFLTDILGEEIVDGVLVESIKQKGKRFAMAFEFDGDVKATRHVLYNCTASRPTISGATNTESIEAQTSELSFTASPDLNGTVRAKTSEKTTEEVYNGWFKAPFVPSSVVVETEQD